MQPTSFKHPSQKEVLQFSSFSCEPLFLVKWKKLSYSKITWEPLSALKGENFDKVKEFLNEKLYINMRTRLQNQKNIKNYMQLIEIGEDNKGRSNTSRLFKKQKNLLDKYICELYNSRHLEMNKSETDRESNPYMRMSQN